MFSYFITSNLPRKGPLFHLIIPLWSLVKGKDPKWSLSPYICRPWVRRLCMLSPCLYAC